MTVEQILYFTKKYGGTGVLTVWLFITYNKVNRLENLLFDCYKAKALISYNENRFPVENNTIPIDRLAVLPDVIKKKEWEDLY